MVRLKKVPPRASPSPRGKKQDSSWWIKWMVTLGGVVAFVMMTLHVSRSNDLKPILELLNPTDTEIMEIKNDVRVDKIKQGKIKQAQDLVAANQQAIAARQHQQQPQLPIILDRSDLIYRRGTWDKAPVIIEKYKLVFFTMPKVGCTEFKKLFRRMMGFANWRDHQYFDPPYLPHNPDANVCVCVWLYEKVRLFFE